MTRRPAAPPLYGPAGAKFPAAGRTSLPYRRGGGMGCPARSALDRPSARPLCRRDAHQPNVVHRRNWRRAARQGAVAIGSALVAPCTFWPPRGAQNPSTAQPAQSYPPPAGRTSQAGTAASAPWRALPCSRAHNAPSASPRGALNPSRSGQAGAFPRASARLPSALRCHTPCTLWPHCGAQTRAEC